MRVQCPRRRAGHADKAAVVKQDEAETVIAEQNEADTAVTDLELNGKVVADCP